MKRLGETMQGRATILPARATGAEVKPGVTDRHRVRVLVVDDSALARQALTRILSRDPGIEVVGDDGQRADDLRLETSVSVHVRHSRMAETFARFARGAAAMLPPRLKLARGGAEREYLGSMCC